LPENRVAIIAVENKYISLQIRNHIRIRQKSCSFQSSTSCFQLFYSFVPASFGYWCKNWFIYCWSVK